MIPKQLMALAAAACIVTTTMTQAVDLPGKTLPEPFGVQIKGHNNDTANLEQIHQLGMRYVRRGFIWEAIEKKPGVYDFSAYDRIVKDCRERNIGIVGCMAFSNKLYGHAKDEAGRAGYAKFAAALAARYKDENILWEIWNEPNTMTFWGKHGPKGNSEPYAEEYVNLVKAVVPAMKAANPNCFVMAGSVSGLWTESWKWQQFCFEKGVLKTGIDAWSVHPYSTKNPEDYVEAYAQLRKMIADAGGDPAIPILNTERGFPIGKAEGYAGGDEKLSFEYQAWHIVRQYLIDHMEGVRLTIWYEWSGNEGFELIKDGKPVPAHAAARVLIDQLNGFNFDQRIKTERPRDFVLRYTHPQGGTTLVAWTAPPPTETADMVDPHDLQIAVDDAREVTVVDLYGNATQKQVVDGNVTVHVTGAPQYIIVKSK
jgi:polysaccharide biosynthesis protein PslG